MLTVVVAVTACIIGPVPHKHKQHVQIKRKEIKRKVIVVVMVECIATVIFYWINPVVAAYIASGLLLEPHLRLQDYCGIHAKWESNGQLKKFFTELSLDNVI